MFRNDKKNFFTSREELLQSMKDIIIYKIEPKILDIFNNKPASKLEVLEVTNNLQTFKKKNNPSFLLHISKYCKMFTIAPFIFCQNYLWTHCILFRRLLVLQMLQRLSILEVNKNTVLFTNIFFCSLYNIIDTE